MSCPHDFNMKECDKIDAKCVDAYMELQLDPIHPEKLILSNSWEDSELDLTPAIQAGETKTHLFLSPTENPIALQYNAEGGAVDCINGDDLSRIISMSKLKDVDQATAPTAGDVYLYDGEKFVTFNLTNFVNTVNNTLSTLANTIQNMQTTIESHGGRISNLETTSNTHTNQISELTTRMGTAENNITSLTNRMGTAETNITNLTTRMGTAEGNITSLTNRMDTAEGNITNLTTRMGTAEGNITSLQNLTGTHTTQISGLTTRMGTAEGNITNLQGRVSTIETTLTPPANAPSGIKVAWGNINLYSDKNNANSKNSGLYTHDLNTNVTNDERFA